MTYDTLKPVPSTDPRDLDDNAQAFDRFLQSTAASEPDRLGQLRKTWHQMELDAAAMVSPNVSALAALTAAADKGVFFSAAGPATMGTYTLTSFTRTLGASVDGAAFRSGISAAKSGANSDITSITGLTTMLPVTQGGTGGSTQAGARTGIAAAALGANSDITSLSGLTTALSIAQGGTGSTSAADALSALGAQTAWANVPLSNSWVTTTRRAVYRKILGQVQIDFNVANGTATDGTLVGLLPAGFRPFSQIAVPVVAAPNVAVTAGVGVPRVIIDTDGTIKCQNCSSVNGIAFNILMPLD